MFQSNSLFWGICRLFFYSSLGAYFPHSSLLLDFLTKAELANKNSPNAQSSRFFLVHSCFDHGYFLSCTSDHRRGHSQASLCTLPLFLNLKKIYMCRGMERWGDIRNNNFLDLRMHLRVFEACMQTLHIVFDKFGFP